VAETVAFRLSKGCIHDGGPIYLYGTTREANENDEYWSIVLRLADSEWGYWALDTRLCGICTLEEEGERVVLCVGINGTMQISDAEGVHDVLIDNSEDGPNDLRHITAVRQIGQEVFAIGMSRMVYRRSPRSLLWYRMDDGIRLPTGTSRIAGLKAIDGDGRGRYLAAGLFGEMWLYEDARWNQLDSPTNVKLEAVRWVRDDLVFVAGARGTLLYGPPRTLKLIDDAEVRDTFWSIEWFRGQLYLATGTGSIYVLAGNGLKRVEPIAGVTITTGYLHAAGGHLLSVGARDALLFDGMTWRCLTRPADGSGVPFDWTAD
jgi:hypothetical protein